MAERVFLMFDYTATGLWHADDADRPAGTVDPDELGLSDETKARLAAWVQRCDDLNLQSITSESTPSGWERARREAEEIWRAIRAEAGPGWLVGIRDADGVAWDEDQLH
jgi:hypothetical protein